MKISTLCTLPLLLACAMGGLSLTAVAAPDFEVIDRFDQSLYTQARQQVFDTAASWENFWKKHSTTLAPEVDFRQYQVLLVMAGERPTPGYGLCVDRIEETPEALKVHLQSKQPAGDAFLPQVNHYPGCVVKVPRQMKDIQFVPLNERVVTAYTSVPTRTLSQITNSLVLEPRKVIVRDAVSYQQLWQLHHPNQSEAPPVNFDQEMVIAIFLGEQSKGGYAVNIDKVIENSQGIEVRYSVSEPKPDEMVIQILTAPTHWVAIRKTDVPIRFVLAPAQRN